MAAKVAEGFILQSITVNNTFNKPILNLTINYEVGISLTYP